MKKSLFFYVKCMGADIGIIKKPNDNVGKKDAIVVEAVKARMDSDCPMPPESYIKSQLKMRDRYVQELRVLIEPWKIKGKINIHLIGDSNTFSSDPYAMGKAKKRVTNHGYSDMQCHIYYKEPAYGDQYSYKKLMKGVFFHSKQDIKIRGEGIVGAGLDTYANTLDSKYETGGGFAHDNLKNILVGTEGIKDVGIIFLGSNDSAWESKESGNSHYNPDILSDEMIANLKKIINSRKKNGIEEIIIATYPTGINWADETELGETKHKQTLRLYNEKVRRMSDIGGIMVVDLAKRFKEKMNGNPKALRHKASDREGHVDYNHYSGEGHKLIAKEFLTALSNIFNQ